MPVISTFPLENSENSLGKCQKYIMRLSGGFIHTLVLALIPAPGGDAAEDPHHSRCCCGTSQRGWVTGRSGRHSGDRGGNVVHLRITKLLLKGWTLTLSPEVNALACYRSQSLKWAALRALCRSWACAHPCCLSVDGFVAASPVAMQLTKGVIYE